MSKNLTRKGIAFGAAAALGATVFAGTPAFATVNDSAVSLVPTSGTEYSIVQDNVFDLESNVSVGAVAGNGNLKFLVTDPSEKILFDYDEDTTGGADSLASAVAITDIAWVDGDVAGATTDPDTVTITTTETGVVVGDIITVASVAGTDGSNAITATQLGLINATQVVTAVGSGTLSFEVASTGFTSSVAVGTATASAGTFTEVTKTSELDSAAVIKNAKATLGLAGLTGLTAPTRAADKSFVVDTGDDDSANTDVLRLVSTAAAGTAATATVTAWIDENGDGDIDGTEDSSSTRTIVFTPWASSGAALTLTQPIAGEANFAAKLTFNSDINASQITSTRLKVALGAVSPTGVIVSAAGSTAVTSGAWDANTGETISWNSATGKKVWELGTISAGVASGVAKSYFSVADVSSSAAATIKVTSAATPALDTFELVDSDSPYGLVAAGDILTVSTAIAVSAGSVVPVGDYKVTSASAGKLVFTGDTSVSSPTTATATTAGAFNINKISPSKTYAAQLMLDGAAYGSIVYSNVASTVVDAAPTIALTRSANAFVGTAGTQSNVRLKAANVSLVASLKKDGKAVAAGVSATVKVSRDSLHADSTITAGGKTLTSLTTAGYIEYTATTNADGKIVIDIANNKGDESDGVTVYVTSGGFTSLGHAIDWNVNVYENYDFSETSAVVNSVKSIVKGAAYNLEWNIADEFGSAPAESWTVKATYTFLGANQTQVVKFIPVTSGKASLAITDGSTATGSYTVAAEALKVNTSSGAPETVNPTDTIYGAVSSYTFNTTVHVRTAVAASAVTAVATATTAGTAGAIELEPDTFTAVDYRVNRNQENTAYSTTEYFTIAGVVTDANGAGLPGAEVTVAGAGLAFTAGDVSAIGSIKVIADATGNYSVRAFSHTAGTVKATVTSGAATKTVDLSVRNSTADSDIANVVVEALAKIPAGYTAAIKATVVDKWGNAVKNANAITVTHTGPGYLSSYPTAVSATDGSVSFVLITVGAKGIANISVKAAVTSLTTDDITVTKGVLVGVSAKITKAATSTVVVKSATGGTIKVVRGTKSKTVVATSNSQKVTLKGGSGTVKVYVNGIKVASK